MPKFQVTILDDSTGTPTAIDTFEVTAQDLAQARDIGLAAYVTAHPDRATAHLLAQARPIA